MKVVYIIENKASQNVIFCDVMFKERQLAPAPTAAIMQKAGALRSGLANPQ